MSSSDDIYAAIRFIPADDRQTWIKVGMAIKAELCDTGFGIWDDWSRTAGNYSERDAQQVWRSFKSGPIQIGTLFHIARKYGYRSDKQEPARPIPQKKAPPPPKRDTGAYAAEIWLRADCSDHAVTTHPYSIAKGIESAGGAGRAIVTGRIVGTDADCLVIPIRDLGTGKVVGVQCISATGDKQSFGRVSGNALLLGNTLDKHVEWFVAEGWASAYSMVFHHFHGNACCATSFGKGNLHTVAQKVAETYAPARLYVLREQDT